MKQKWTADQIPDLSGKIFIITGANSGIGYEATREVARKGARVILASRNPDKAENAINRIKDEIPSGQLEFIKLDLASFKSIGQFVETFKSRYKKLDVLLNNAGIMLVPYGQTVEGFERTVGINHLGHFVLTGLLMETISQTRESRVVNISSNAHYRGEMDFEDLVFSNKREYAPMKAYGRSKLANLLFTYELQRRFEEHNIDAIATAAHPGISATGLADHLFFNKVTWLIEPAMRILFQSSAMGALPSLRAAVDPDVQGGQYYGPDGEGEKSGYPVLVDSNDMSKSQKFGQKLWEVSQALTGICYL